MKKIAFTIFYLFFPLFLGGIVGFLISGSIDYQTLVKPPFAPPAILFPIVWTIIYLLMGISYYLLTRQVDYRPIEKMIYYLSLGVNVLWPVFFFLCKWRFFSIIWILLLSYLVYILIKVFKTNSKISAYLNIPYLAWCLFATYLNVGIYLLN